MYIFDEINSMSIDDRMELHYKAYGKYFDNYYNNKDNSQLMTYNQWYGTDMHTKYLTPLLRKYKLEKIAKAD